MNWGILAFVIIYEVLTVVGVGLVIARKNKHSVEEGNFALAGKGLPTAQVGVTLALTMLGSAHIWCTCENAYSMGSIATWFGIACTVMMIVITQITGPWVRKIGTAAMITMFVSWIANIVWVTCGLQERLGMVNFHQVYLCMIVSVILGLVLTAVLPGTKPGYFRLSKEEKAAC